MPIQFYWGSGGEKPPTRMTCTKCINQYITGFASSYPHERNNWACRSTSSKSPQLYPIWVCLKIGNPGLLPNPAVYHNFSSMAINWGPTRPPYILSHTKMILSEIYYTKQNGANHILPTLSQKRSIDIPILGQFFFSILGFLPITHQPFMTEVDVGLFGAGKAGFGRSHQFRQHSGGHPGLCQEH